jgi:3-methyladenine DNA glycosylase AlkD
MNLEITLYQLLKKNQNIENQSSMEAYMKNNFKFFGIKANDRRAIFKQFLTENNSELKTNFRSIAHNLYLQEERECHYCAIELLIHFSKKDCQITDIEIIKKLILTHSWWDSVDTISAHLLGNYLKKFPEKSNEIIDDFSNFDNIWLNRSTLIFQLLYKNKVNKEILFALCEKFSESKEFFIQKAIGWALRNYAKINPDEVSKFVNHQNLKPLSVREALKHIKK